MIRATSSGHVPQLPFILVTMGGTGVLLIGWRALLCQFTAKENSKSDDYRRGSPFELFEVRTSLFLLMASDLKKSCFDILNISHNPWLPFGMIENDISLDAIFYIIKGSPVHKVSHMCGVQEGSD